MNTSKKYCINVLATGFVSLTIFSVPLFWGRFFSDLTLTNFLPNEAENILISPSLLLPDDIENDPNVARHSEIRAWTRYNEVALSTLGIANNFINKIIATVYYYDNHECIYFDKKIGLIVHMYWMGNDEPYLTEYAGPNGISQTPEKSLGRFDEMPIGAVFTINRDNFVIVIYDKKHRCFSRIRFNDKTVVKGPEIPNDKNYDPVQIGLWRAKYDSPDLNWNNAMKKVILPADGSKEQDRVKPSYERLEPVNQTYGPEFESGPGQYILVLDASGRIDLVDRETLEFAGTAGHLLAYPDTDAAIKTGYPAPKDVLAYTAMPLINIFQGRTIYKGLYVACINRQANEMSLGVFDENGRLIKMDFTQTLERYYGKGNPIPSHKAVYSTSPGSPLTTVIKFLLENLHPPLFNELSYWTADTVEASSAGRSLFLMPNSFIAIKARQAENYFSRLIEAFVIMLPSIILSVWLAVRVNKDASKVGLSENARTFWLFGTICFGLPAYITYRITRPQIRVVTCPNCGNLRRPDMDLCHQCKSKWHIPELDTPLWRVTDKPSN